MTQDKIKCRMVFFDAGMTLVQPVPEFQEGICKVLNMQGFPITREDVEHQSVGAIEYLIAEINSGRRYAVSDRADEEFWGDVYEHLVRRLGIHGDARSVGLEIYYFYRRPVSFDVFPNSRATIRTLADRGFRLGVISNFSTMLNDVFRLHDIRDFFDPFIVSAEENLMKPDREIYELALSRAGVPAHECIMVGDNPVDDVRGAGEAGVMGVLLDRFGRHPDAPEPRISSLTQLPDLLELPD